MAEPKYTCSFCSRIAKYFGEGQDGDFYCEVHVSKAPGSVYTDEDSE